MHWFKIVLLCVIGLGVILNLKAVSKGSYQKTESPTINAIGAIVQLLFFFGIWVYLN